MDILELSYELNLQPKRVSASKGGIYHSPCPSCGGKDRFTIWLGEGKYYCRQCKKHGNAVNFCKDFMGMNYLAACAKVGQSSTCRTDRRALKPEEVFFPSSSWEERALAFIKSCHNRLLVDKKALALVQTRGLSLETINKHLIGWQPIDQFDRRENWGLEKRIVEGKEKKLCLPKGIVIPSFHGDLPIKVKIRRSEYKEGDLFGKYYEISGGSNRLPIFGDLTLPVTVLVEAELDAMLTVQEAGDLCSCLALGGAKKKADNETQEWLNQKKFIIYALDFDSVGNGEYSFWKKNYSNIKAWPVPKEKSPGDAFNAGVNLRSWIQQGIELAQRM